MKPAGIAAVVAMALAGMCRSEIAREGNPEESGPTEDPGQRLVRLIEPAALRRRAKGPTTLA